MKQQPQVKIVSYNMNGVEVCASAARISTTPGDAIEIFTDAQNNPKNVDLIKKVLKSGHKSLIEHSVFTLAFWNVSAFVEQYLIECRLASFTVKSRRYVDFSGFGYHIPSELDGNHLTDYCRYMNLLFSAYKELLDTGVPKEDARFVLPYSFHSNFYCTLNARELIHIIRSIQYGRGRGIPELQELAGQLVLQAQEICPFLLPELERPSPNDHANAAPLSDLLNLRDAPSFVEARQAGAAALISAPSDPIDILRTAYQVSNPCSPEPFTLDGVLASQRPRELEQLSYLFRISNITLAGITHMVRHRMQSIIIPPIQSLNHSQYIAPESIKTRPGAWEIYQSRLNAAHDLLKMAARNPLLKKYGYYFAVSGNMMTVMTTMNARELNLFIRLRSCNRAQWEIRNTAISMLKLLRAHSPEVFGHFGPSCYLFGYCPEGKLACGKMDEVRARFGSHDSGDI